MIKISAGPYIVIDQIETDTDTEYVIRLSPEVEKVLNRLQQDDWTIDSLQGSPGKDITLGDGSRLEFL